jgi:hypothetical protein
MIANLLTVLVGLWLSYRAIFSIPARELGQAELTTIGAVLIMLAFLARRSDLMRWHSTTITALGVVILGMAAAHYLLGADPLLMFWLLLLIGITAAITALWSTLYRPEAEQLPEVRDRGFRPF